MLAKRVAADTITDMTSAPDFAAAGSVPVPPSVKSLIEDIRRQLRDQREAMEEKSQNNPQDSGLRVKFNRAARHPVDFEKILKNLPEGFDLVPVFYSHISQEKNQHVSREYLSESRADFLTFLGEHHEEDLRKLGICDRGIERLKRGLDAADKDGNFYELSVDHIIERSGSGRWSEDKKPDPDHGGKKKLPVNHFGNFILLPEKVHHFKNELNALQKIALLGEGEGQWILMMAPQRNGVYKGFVCPPQAPGHPLAGLDKRPPDTGRRISHAAFVISRASETLDKLLLHPQVAANDNALASSDPFIRKQVSFLRGALAETAGLVSGIFNDLSQNKTAPKGKNEFDSFVRFYQGGKLRRLRERGAKLPFEEAKQMKAAFDKMDGEIRAMRQENVRDQEHQVPSNDNAFRKRSPLQAPQLGRRHRRK